MIEEEEKEKMEALEMVELVDKEPKKTTKFGTNLNDQMKKLNDQSGPRTMYVGNSLRLWAKACVRRHIPTYAARVSEVLKR